VGFLLFAPFRKQMIAEQTGANFAAIFWRFAGEFTGRPIQWSSRSLASEAEAQDVAVDVH
jgi:hypothetical protein